MYCTLHNFLRRRGAVAPVRVHVNVTLVGSILNRRNCLIFSFARPGNKAKRNESKRQSVLTPGSLSALCYAAEYIVKLKKNLLLFSSVRNIPNLVDGRYLYGVFILAMNNRKLIQKQINIVFSSYFLSHFHYLFHYLRSIPRLIFF